MSKKERVVIALGGNAIQCGEPTAEAQIEAIRITVKQLINLIKEGYEVVITHGNGPQVGNILLQQAAADSALTPAMALDTCGAMSQGMIGYWMQNVLSEELEKAGLQKNVATIITQTEVDQNDPAFSSPSKPIGPFYSEEEAKNLQNNHKGFVFKEDAGRGYRRVVPSPKPVKIKENDVISRLVESGDIVIAVGGGGIPVVNVDGHLRGVEAVIDKDYASQKLAESIDADVLLILTGVDHVCINFNKPNQKKLTTITPAEIEGLIEENQFAKGSMLEKVEAAYAFSQSKHGRKAIITSLENALEALKYGSGTIISQ